MTIKWHYLLTPANATFMSFANESGIGAMIKAAELEFDRAKVLAWWTGRISNAELAEWSGQTERDVRLILSTDFMKTQVSGGGRGSKRSRRLSRKARNAVALVSALRDAHFSIETAAAVFNAVPVLAEFPSGQVDFSPPVLGALGTPYATGTNLYAEEPDGGWSASDVVPWHIYHRKARPIVRNGTNGLASIGDIAWYPEWIESREGQLPDGYIPFGEQMYRPEIDPMGLYEFGNKQVDAFDDWDSHFYIVDGAWVFYRHSDPDPRNHMQRIFERYELGLDAPSDPKPTHTFSPIALIEGGGKYVRSLRGDDDAEQAAWRAWKQPKSKLDINATFAVRQMKRTAYGLIGAVNE